MTNAARALLKRLDALRDQTRTARRIQQLVAGLPIPRSLDPDAIAQAISVHRGRTVTITLLPSCPELPEGMQLRMPTRDGIGVDQNLSPAHALFVILHEIGHLYLDDGDGGNTSRCHTDHEAVVELFAGLYWLRLRALVTQPNGMARSATVPEIAACAA